MRGADVTQKSMFSYMTVSKFVPPGHPLRPIQKILNTALREMDETFTAMYADSGRDSIPPEQLLRGLILQSLYEFEEPAAAVRATGLQHAVSVVRWPERGQGSVGSLHLHEEPRPADRWR